ncbi:thioredoxin family protein [Isoptericola aurantiacus]|uniref:thioredoxin family protein n=1 Tax=Isoptericola aurantiacus TaxID=3377839 RepID=UPI00383A5C3F
MTPQWPALAALVVLTAVVGLVWRARQGRVRVHDGGARPGAAGTVTGGWAADVVALGAAPGARATFLQFSAEVCAPCRATARTLGALAADEDDVAHVEVDVAEHLDLVRRAGVLRTPTVLVLDGAGSEIARASGAMTPVQARAALDAAAPAVPVPGRTS